MISSVVFDLGNTLIHYYTREQIPEVLEKSLLSCINFLDDNKLPHPDWNTIQQRYRELEKQITGDKVYPMQHRLSYLFDYYDEKLLLELCEAYMKPLRGYGAVYDDVKPVLTELKKLGYNLAVLTNSPWGCPSSIWKRELVTHDIAQFIDTTVCCYDAGWRKPDPRVFHYLLEKMGEDPGNCIFIGDDPRWDVDGPKAVGMNALLLDRSGEKEDSIQNLHEVISYLHHMS